jgi:hypothetical protein
MLAAPLSLHSRSKPVTCVKNSAKAVFVSLYSVVTLYEVLPEAESTHSTQASLIILRTAFKFLYLATVTALVASPLASSPNTLAKRGRLESALVRVSFPAARI